MLAQSPAPAQVQLVNVTNVPLPNSAFRLAASGNYLYACGPNLRVFDISTAAFPIQIANVPLALQGCELSISSKYLYILDADRFHAGHVYVFDISTPSDPVAVTYFDIGWWSSVAGSGQYLYAGGLQIYDFSNPLAPTLLGQVSTPRAVMSSVPLGQYVYLAVLWTGLGVCDVSSPSSPRIVGTGAGPSLSFDVAAQPDYAYIADGTNGLWVYNVSAPTNPITVFHEVRLDAEAVRLTGNYSYVLGGQLCLLNVTDPTNAQLVASYGQGGQSLAVSRSYAYVAQSDTLGVYSFGGPTSPPLTISITLTNTLVLTWPTPAPAFALQQSTGLTGSDWSTFPDMPKVVNSKNQILVRTPVKPTFYRLVAQ